VDTPSMTRRAFAQLALFLCVLAPAAASETDSFTQRYEPMADATEALNRHTNDLLELAVTEANALPAGAAFIAGADETQGCSETALYEAIDDRMEGPIFGAIESYVNDTDATDHRRLPRRLSIYREFSFLETPSMGGSEGRLASTVRIGRNTVGADKLGHFFSQGFVYFQKAYLLDEGLDAALHYGDLTERTYYGALLTGVYSYADLAANFNGMRFWIHLLRKYPDPLREPRTPGPYVRCVDSRWVKVRDFDWRDYVDAAWDEGVNCNLFRNAALAERIRTAVADLEQRTGKRMTCPISPRLAPQLHAKYRRYFDRLVNLSGSGTLDEAVKAKSDEVSQAGL
jgi:hypothetical protein